MGHLEVIKWLYTNTTRQGYVSYILDIAAENGHLEVVKWLGEN